MNKYLIITFANLTEALAFEDKARGLGLAGRLIPVPAQVASGCGMCWREEIKNKAILDLHQDDLVFEEAREFLL